MAKKKEVECDVCEDWLATYGDMVTLLMCFFILLMSSSKVDVALFEQIQSSLNESVGGQDLKEKPVEMLMMELSEDIQSMDLGETIALGSDSQGVVLDIPMNISFKKGTAVLKKTAEPVLKRIAATLKADRYSQFRFSIDGHTHDQIEENSKYPSNWELSSARASTIVRFLQKRGILPEKLRATGYADIAPRFPNRDIYGEPIPKNQQRNQRIEIHIEPAYK